MDSIENQAFGEEELWSYEIGTKVTFWDNRLIVNAAAYYMDIEDMQVIEYTAPTTPYITNAAEASGHGFELDVTARLIGGLSVVAGFGYNHLDFDKLKMRMEIMKATWRHMPRNIRST